MRKWPSFWYVKYHATEILGNDLTFDIVRCGLTSLAIQEPGISKYCSTCQTEFLDEELIVRLRDEAPSPVFMSVARAFDTCPSCNSKFKCSNLN